MQKTRMFFVLSAFSMSTILMAQMPAKFDLRNVNGNDFVSAVKSQQGGTCWTHAVMASIESNLMMTTVWENAGESGEPDLAEYHLDWWNGFNKKYNADIAPRTGGLTVHQGGDYLVASAYMARGEGSVRNSDAQSYNSAPAQHADSYHAYYSRDIEWFDAGPSLQNIDTIKKALMNDGAIGTALAWSSSFYSSSSNSFYQPNSSTMSPNHAVTIVGWDDNKVTKASQPGAWLIKNSWGSGWGEGGYFWISYYDKVAGHHREMGAVQFRNTEPWKYSNVYSHDYHGWRATKANASTALNAFTAGNVAENLASVSFYTAAADVDYEVQVYGSFDGHELSDLLVDATGHYDNMGFHTVDLDSHVALQPGQKFYILVRLSHGGHAYDKTSDVPVLLGGEGKVIVESFATAGQSYYLTESGWKDLQVTDDRTANFCIKGLTVR